MMKSSLIVAAMSLGMIMGFAPEADAGGPKDHKPSVAEQDAGQMKGGKRGKRQRPSFEQLDKNGDGKIVASEVPARLWKRLSRADANKDGAVTKAELDAAKANRGKRGKNGRRGRRSFEQLDKNGDGKIVASEVPERAWKRLSRLDANKDGAVTKAEFAARSRS